MLPPIGFVVKGLIESDTPNFQTPNNFAQSLGLTMKDWDDYLQDKTPHDKYPNGSTSVAKFWSAREVCKFCEVNNWDEVKDIPHGTSEEGPVIMRETVVNFVNNR